MKDNFYCIIYTLLWNFSLLVLFKFAIFPNLIIKIIFYIYFSFCLFVIWSAFEWIDDPIRHYFNKKG